MADLNTVVEDPSAESNSLEKRGSRPRVTLSRNPVALNTVAGNPSVSNTGGNQALKPRQASRNSIPRPGYDRRFIRYENTYRMEPDDEHKVDLARARRIATSVIETAMTGYKYDPNQAKQLAATLADRIRNQMKQLPFQRYKIVAQVCIGQKKGQDLRFASRCVWDTKWDRHITITKETSDAYVAVTLFFVYTD